MTASPTLQELVERLRELEKEATPGPWEWQNGCSWWRLGTRAKSGNVICPTNHPVDRHPDLIVSRDDRELIVDLRNSLPLILRALEALGGAEEALEKIIAPVAMGTSIGPLYTAGASDGLEYARDIARAALAQIKAVRG